MKSNGVTDAEYAAYYWVGSAPCEGCDKFKECDEKGITCDEMKKWRADYNKAIVQFSLCR